MIMKTSQRSILVNLFFNIQKYDKANICCLIFSLCTAIKDKQTVFP